MSSISKILFESNDNRFFCCDNGKGVFVFQKTTGKITKIDFNFGDYISDIISLGNNMIAIVSSMKYGERRVNVFGLFKTNPPRHLGQLQSEPSTQETCATVNSRKSIFVAGSYNGMLTSYSMNPDGTFKCLGNVLTQHSSSSGVLRVQFHPRIPNLLFVVVGKMILQYNVSDSGEFTLLAELSEHPDWIKSLVFSPDGTMMASGSFGPKEKNTLIVWTINGIEPAVLTQILQGHTNVVNSVAFNHDGTVLASGSSDQTIRIWKKEGEEWICKQVLGEPNSGPIYNFINDVVFDPTDQNLLISGSSTGEVVSWRLSADGIWSFESVIRME